MDNDNCKLVQAEPNMKATEDDWRTGLLPDSRQRIVSKIKDILSRHLPVSGPEELVELNKIAVRFEEKIYSAATSQSEYLRKISSKMLTVEDKYVNSGAANSLPSNYAGSSENPQDQMDSNNWKPAPAEPNMEATDDWRTKLQPDSRRRVVTKIKDTLSRHHSVSGSEVLVELDKVAVSFEEKIYTAATSQSDYLRKISLRMLSMEAKSVASGAANSLPSNHAGSSENP